MAETKKRPFDPARFFGRLKRSLNKRVVGWRLRNKFGESWSAEGNGSDFLKREYKSYEDYIEHQRAKLAIYDLDTYDVKFREVLRDRLASTGTAWSGQTVLCLAARIGTEVKAFLDLGCFAIGIDLNPGEKNRYVVQGDFHDLQYSNGSIDFVYTNSLDHAFDIRRIAGEVHRVLAADGHFIVEAVAGKLEGVNPGFFESLSWAKVDDLAAIIGESGFQLINRQDFAYPWSGKQLWFKKSPA
jgi:SAM-dependent methyltransferase